MCVCVYTLLHGRAAGEGSVLRNTIQITGHEINCCPLVPGRKSLCACVRACLAGARIECTRARPSSLVCEISFARYQSTIES